MADTGIPILDKINLPTVGRYAAGGAIGGAGVAAALNLVHMLREIMNERKEKDPLETDEGTIVLTIPKRGSADTKDLSEKDRSKKTKVVTQSTQVQMHKISDKKQPRHYDGKYGNKMDKKANWQTLAASILAMGGAGSLGYALVDKLYEIKRMKEKEQKLNQAKSEYLDKLQGGMKAAADDRTFNKLDYPFGIAALALLLGSGGTAWLTKRILDEYRKEPEPEEDPRVKRIVFKTAEDESNEEMDKEAAETASALIGIYLDICSGEPAIVGSEKCAQYLKSIGMTPGDIYKMAAYKDDYYSLLATLDQNPEFRKLLQRMSMEKHPILKYFKWAVGLPGVRSIADNKLYKAVEEEYGLNTLPGAKPEVNIPAGADKVAEVKQAGPIVEIIKKLVEQVRSQAKPAPVAVRATPIPSEEADDKEDDKDKKDKKPEEEAEKKALGLPNLKDIASSYTGSTIAENAMKRREKKERKKEKELTAEELLQQLEIAGADPQSAEFIRNNADKIKEVLQVLALQGKI